MIITEVLERNARIHPNEVSLVEINPALRPTQATWRDYSLIVFYEGKPTLRACAKQFINTRF